MQIFIVGQVMISLKKYEGSPYIYIFSVHILLSSLCYMSNTINRI